MNGPHHKVEFARLGTTSAEASLKTERFAGLLNVTTPVHSKPDMLPNTRKLWSHGHPRPSDPSRTLGAVLIALSLLRWPVTAMLAAPAWELPVSPWVLISVVQACAEATFWIGVWLVGRKHLHAALARIAGAWPVSAILVRASRLPRLVKTRSAISDD